MDGEGSTTLNVKSELEFPSIPNDIVFPDELNRYLRDQIQYLLHENGMLKKHLSEKEIAMKNCAAQIESLSAKLKEYENSKEVNQFTQPETLASVKIVELGKKLREKNAEVGSLRTKCSKLEQKIVELTERELQSESSTDKPSNVTEVGPNEEHVKRLTEKVNSLSLKLAESKNANNSLKNDLKMANKWLQQEIGESFESMLNTNNASNWRGRAQIILDLHQKNNELRDKLKAYQGKAAIPVANTPSKNDIKLENLTKDFDTLKTTHDDLKKKFETSKARCKVLETECTILKTKLASLSAQTERDQKILTSMSGQLTSQQELHTDSIKQKDKIIKGLQQSQEQLRVELSKLKCNIENLERQVKEKEQEIKELVKIKRHGSSNSGSPRRLKQHGIYTESEKKLNRLEAERLRLLELTEVQTGRLERERDAHFKTQNQLRSERQKNAKLEGSIARLELDHSSSKSGSYCMMSSNRTDKEKEKDSTYKDKLEIAEENMKALQTRLEIEQHERKKDLQEFSKILREYK